MILGYARVSTDGQSVNAQVAALRKHGAGKVFREVASGAKTDRAQLRRVIGQLDAGDVLLVTRLDRLARSTRDLLNTLAAITDKKAGFRSLGDTWADTTTPHGRLMLTVMGGLAEFERELIRARTGEGRERGKEARCPLRPQAETDPAAAQRSSATARRGRGNPRRAGPALQCAPKHDFKTRGVESHETTDILAATDRNQGAAVLAPREDVQGRRDRTSRLFERRTILAKVRLVDARDRTFTKSLR
jgi:DNA invertase Pin-like site-specific DNA recombinase